MVGRGGREVNGWPGVDQDLFEQRAALGEWPRAVVLVAAGQDVEGDEASRGLFSQPVHPAGGGVNALLQHLEFQPLADHDHDFAVDDAPFGQVRFDCLDDLGEVAGHRQRVAGADLHLVAVAENNRSEAVPLGLEAQRTVGYLGH